MDADHVAGDLESVLFSEAEIAARVATLAQELGRDYAGREPVLIGVLGGAATFTVDLARAFEGQLEITWMAIRSYTTRNRASGSVRLLKDLDLDIAGRDVIIVDGVIDTGLTMSWLITNLAQRGPASVAVCALLRKTDTPQFTGTKTYIGFDAPPGLIVGYGLDYRGRYRNLTLRGRALPAGVRSRHRPMTAILFDFFGTLVSYSPSRTTQGFPRSHALAPDLPYAEFLTDAGRLLRHGSTRPPTPTTASSRWPRSPPRSWAARSRIRWSRSSSGPMSRNGRPASRTSTVCPPCSPTCGPGTGSPWSPTPTAPRWSRVSWPTWGWPTLFDAVVLSVQVGWRKPHPAMYAAALHALAVPSAEAVFVGDSLRGGLRGTDDSRHPLLPDRPGRGRSRRPPPGLGVRPARPARGPTPD